MDGLSLNPTLIFPLLTVLLTGPSLWTYAQTGDSYRYCYLRSNCVGGKPGDAEGPVTEDQCCGSPGAKSWGVQGQGQCTPCPEADDDIEVNAFAPDSPTVVENNDDSPCLSYGPNYYRTFDGLEYQFEGRCSYTVYSRLSQSVSVRMIDCYSHKKCKKELIIKLNDGYKVVAIGGDIKVNDASVEVTNNKGYASPNSGVHLNKRGEQYQLSYGNLRVRLDNKDTWFITGTLSEKGNTDTVGLCGNFNGDPLNDMTTSSGEKVTSPAEFGNSFATPDASGTCPDATDSGNQCRDADSRIQAKNACNPIRRNPFSKCHSKVAFSDYYQRCANDYCGALKYTQTLDDKDEVRAELNAVRCGVFSAYSAECSRHSVVFIWRILTGC